MNSLLISAGKAFRKTGIMQLKRSNYNLRPRAHAFSFPLKDDRNFIPLLLFRDKHAMLELPGNWGVEPPTSSCRPLTSSQNSTQGVEFQLPT